MRTIRLISAALFISTLLASCSPKTTPTVQAYIKWLYTVIFKAITPRYTMLTDLVLYHDSLPGNNIGIYISNRENDLSLCGKWELSNDTLTLYPHAYIGIRHNEWAYNPELEPDSYESIPQKYKIRNDTLFNITDYTALHKSVEAAIGLKVDYDYATSTMSPSYKLHAIKHIK